jgi:hypothetical protein
VKRAIRELRRCFGRLGRRVKRMKGVGRRVIKELRRCFGRLEGNLGRRMKRLERNLGRRVKREQRNIMKGWRAYLLDTNAKCCHL